MDHQAILEAATMGDDKALELLVRAYHDRVYRFGLRACRDPFDAGSRRIMHRTQIKGEQRPA